MMRPAGHALSTPTVSNSELKIKSRQIGYICRDLHAKRVLADYRLAESFAYQDAQQAMQQAKKIYELAK
ncbi:hypothetical protein H0A71_09950 [Alcaligenaceae bacterium]|nr:hypothetical protein [Alcaligenaceae bacterium]